MRVGLDNRVVETDEFPDRVLDLVRELAAAPPQAVRFAKEAIYDAVGASLDQMLDYEEEAQKACFESEDSLEGFTAFAEKRLPRFKGK